MNYDHLKHYSDFRGLDLRSSEVLRPPGFAREFKNVMHTPQGGLSPRFGYQYRSVDDPDQVCRKQGEHGVFPYEAMNVLQSEKAEILGCTGVPYAAPLWRRTAYSATFTNTHLTLAATFTIAYDTATAQMRCTIVRGGVTLLDLALGTGLEGSPVTLGTLVTTVDALADITMVRDSGTGTMIAAFADVGESVVAAAGGTYVLAVYGWRAVNTPRFQWNLTTASISTANDTITLSYDALYGKHFNPLKTGDNVRFIVGSGGVLPAGLAVATDYWVVGATKTTVQIAASLGGVAIDITTTGTVPFAIISTTINPGATFWNYYAQASSTEYRPVSSAMLRNVRYFSSGRTAEGTFNGNPIRESAGLTKYDSQSFYRAGLPKIYPLSTGATAVGAGVVASFKGSRAVAATFALAATRAYRCNLKAIDKVGNIIEGALSDVSVAVNAAGANPGAFVIPTSIGDLNLVSRLGFNGNYAISGAATALNFPATDGFGNAPNVHIGDILYFWDERQDRFIQRECTAVSATTITIAATSLDLDKTSPTYDDGETPTFNNNTPISANVRIVIWRTEDGGTDYFLWDEVPWTPLTITMYDDKADNDLTDQLIEKPYNADLPPSCRYMTRFNEQLIIFGDDKRNRTVSFEDIETPEGFPAGTHELDLPRKATGAAQTGPFLICATEESLHEISGDLSEFKFRVDQIANNVGVTSHFSMREAEEGMLFFQSKKGPYGLINGRDLLPLGVVKMPDGKTAGRLEPYFTKDYSRDTLRPYFERSIGVVIENLRWYILFVPVETSTGNDLIKTRLTDTLGTGSIAYVFDYGRGAWYRWLNVDFSNMCEFQDGLHFVTKTSDGTTTALVRYGHLLMTRGKWNYCDHASPSTWDAQQQWEALGKPAIFKKFLRCRISSYETRLATSCTFDLNTFLDYDITKQGTDDTLTFGATTIDLKPKLASEAVRSLLVQFTGSRPYEPMVITGYELEAAAPFREVFKE